MGTPYKKATDSPSRQLLYELNQLAISQQQGFYAHLDREGEQREGLHRQALAAAALKHDRVRQNAEIEKQRLEAEEEAARKRQEEEQRRALERQQHEVQVAEKKRLVERQRLAEQREQELARAEREAQEAADRRDAERKRQEVEKVRKAQEESDTRLRQQEAARAAEAQAKQAAAAAAAAQKHQFQLQQQIDLPPKSPPKTSTAAGKVVQSNPEWEVEHTRYLQIHKQLKDLRKLVNSKTKEQPALKAAVGDMRRDIKKSVGQLTGENRKKPLSTILAALRKALNVPEPQVSVLPFFARPLQNVPSDSNGPAVLLYLLNVFTKSIIAQFIDEAGVNPKAADPVGIVACHIFAIADFRWQGHSLIDILLAKYHVVAPALFGIYGPENTAEGKTRLGWWREDGRFEGPFIPPQRHFERMTGLGAGFAALSLRNYEKVKVENPFPDRHYWETLARIVNIPRNQITQTHFVLLKGLIENFETKFIGFFGGAAVAALRLALVELPATCPPSATSKSLAGLADVLRREQKLIL